VIQSDISRFYSKKCRKLLEIKKKKKKNNDLDLNFKRITLAAIWAVYSWWRELEMEAKARVGYLQVRSGNSLELKL
jgi:hypothetical protein